MSVVAGASGVEEPMCPVDEVYRTPWAVASVAGVAPDVTLDKLKT